MTDSSVAALNSPLEVGLRGLIILVHVHPDSLDIGRLVLLDHALLRSGDLGGPPSIHPSTPVRPGELGVKRQLMEDGMQLMIRSSMVVLDASTEAGFVFQATEDAGSFVSVLSAPYIQQLRSLADWVHDELHPLSDQALRQRMRQVYDLWTSEFVGGSDVENGGKLS